MGIFSFAPDEWYHRLWFYPFMLFVCIVSLTYLAGRSIIRKAFGASG